MQEVRIVTPDNSPVMLHVALGGQILDSTDLSLKFRAREQDHDDYIHAQYSTWVQRGLCIGKAGKLALGLCFFIFIDPLPQDAARA